MLNTSVPNKKAAGIIRKAAILFFILAIGILLNHPEAKAANIEFTGLTGEYQTIGDIQVKVSLFTLYAKIDGKEYSYTVSPKYGVSAVSNGADIYYKLALHDTLYKWDPVTGKNTKVATLTCGTDSAWINGGYGDELFLIYEHPYTMYRFSLTTQKTTRVKKNVTFVAQYGKNVFLQSTDNSGVLLVEKLYLYNAKTQKLTTLCSKELGYTISGKWLYYAKVTKTDSSKNPYTIAIKAYNMSTGKTKTLAKGIKTWNRTFKITKSYVLVYRNGTYTTYKYKYSTGKYTKYTY